jgi:hypothetical protein
LEGGVMIERGVEEGVQGGELSILVAIGFVCGGKRTGVIEWEFVGFAGTKAWETREVGSMRFQMKLFGQKTASEWFKSAVVLPRAGAEAGAAGSG